MFEFETIVDDLNVKTNVQGEANHPALWLQRDLSNEVSHDLSVNMNIFLKCSQPTKSALLGHFMEWKTVFSNLM